VEAVSASKAAPFSRSLLVSLPQTRATAEAVTGSRVALGVPLLAETLVTTRNPLLPAAATGTRDTRNSQSSSTVPEMAPEPFQVSDKCCAQCRQQFCGRLGLARVFGGARASKHQCRECRRTVCGACAPQSSCMPASLGSGLPERVCIGCSSPSPSASSPPNQDPCSTGAPLAAAPNPVASELAGTTVTDVTVPGATNVSTCPVLALKKVFALRGHGMPAIGRSVLSSVQVLLCPGPHNSNLKLK
jgi:hypothetical protein